MDIYNRIPRRRSCRIVAPLRAVLTTGYPLLTAPGFAFRVLDASRPDRQGVLDDNVQWKDPARRAHRITPVETKAGQPAHRMEHSRNFSTRRSGLKPSMAPRQGICAHDVRNLSAVSRNRSFKVIQGDCREQREDRE